MQERLQPRAFDQRRVVRKGLAAEAAPTSSRRGRSGPAWRRLGPRGGYFGQLRAVFLAPVRQQRRQVGRIAPVHRLGAHRGGVPLHRFLAAVERPKPERQRRRHRSEERRVGKEWVRTCRSRWSPEPSKKNKKIIN